MNLTHPAAGRHLRLGVIVGSTREQRFGETVARWLLDHASGFDWLALDLICGRELDLQRGLWRRAKSPKSRRLSGGSGPG